MSADTLAQVPDTDHASMVATDKLALVRMNDYIIDRSPVNIVALQATSPSIPDLDSSILGACDHPFPLTMECDTGNVVRVTFEGNHRIRVGRLDIKELDSIMTRSSQKSLIRGDTKAIDLGIWMLNCSRTDA